MPTCINYPLSKHLKIFLVYAVIFFISWFGMVGLSLTGWFLQHHFYNAGWLEPIESIAAGCCVLFILTIPVGLIGVCVWLWVSDLRSLG